MTSFYPYIPVILGALTLTAFCILRDEKGSTKALILKAITSCLFILTAFLGIVFNQQSDLIIFYGLILVGGLFGLIGDITLDLKIIYKENQAQSDTYTHLGIGMFAVGHIFYIVSIFLYFGGFNWLPLVIAVAVAIAILLVTKFLMKFDYGKFLIEIGLYTFLLTYFTVSSLFAVINLGNTSSIILLVGSVLFLASDAVLGQTYFKNNNSKSIIVLNHILYYVAQFLIAISILYMV